MSVETLWFSFWFYYSLRMDEKSNWFWFWFYDTQLKTALKGVNQQYLTVRCCVYAYALVKTRLYYYE